jgi:hypothetical protein
VGCARIEARERADVAAQVRLMESDGDGGGDGDDRWVPRSALAP